MHKIAIVPTLLYMILVTLLKLNNSLAEQLVIHPKELNTLREGIPQILKLSFANCTSAIDTPRNITIRLIQGSDESLVYPQYVYNVPCAEENGAQANVTLKGNRVGFVKLGIDDKRTQVLLGEYDIGIIRPLPAVQDLVYQFGLMACIVLITLCFGLSLDLQNVKKHLKRPVGPAIGMGCQFIIMPLIAFGLSFIITSHPASKLGIFACGAAPGGGFSNVLVMVLNGDVDLSITMTFISTIVAMGFVPLWIYTLGQWIVQDYTIVFPFINMLQTLALLVVPLTLGILVTKFLPKVSKILLYLQIPSIFIMFVFAVGLNIWVNLYAFRVVAADYQLLLCAIFLPYAGGIAGFAIASALKQDRKIAMTVAIETAIQNINMVIVLLTFSLPQPWADISSAIPITSLVFTAAPFPFLLCGLQLHQRYLRHKEKPENDIEDDMKMKSKEGVDNTAVTPDEDI